MRRVVAVTEAIPVRSNSDLIYSANPLEVLADDGASYILKGGEPGIAFAEAAAYELASTVGLSVPPHAVCAARDPDSGTEKTFLGSQKMGIRLPVEALVESGAVRNPELLAEMIAFDLWVANSDRNIGNIVAAASADGLRLYAIDFEKAEVLRGRKDRFAITAMDSRKFWPLEGLGRLCQARTRRPNEMLRKIREQASEDHRALLERTVWELDLPDIGWLDSASALLGQRAERIHEMAEEVWP